MPCFVCLISLFLLSQGDLQCINIFFFSSTSLVLIGIVALWYRHQHYLRTLSPVLGYIQYIFMYICKYTVLQFDLIVLISKWLNVFNPGVRRDHVCIIYSAALYIYICWVFFAVSVGHECQKNALHMHNRVTIKLRDVRLLHVKCALYLAGHSRLFTALWFNFSFYDLAWILFKSDTHSSCFHGEHSGAKAESKVCYQLCQTVRRQPCGWLHIPQGRSS